MAKKNLRAILLGMLFVFGTDFLCGQEERISSNLRVILAGMTEPQPPFSREGRFIITYRSEEPTAETLISFAHENFRIFHRMQLNEFGVYIYVGALPDLDVVEYRLLVDGLWIADPLAEENYTDSYYTTISRYTLQTELITAETPVFTGNQIHFYLEENPGQRIALVANFNRWQAFTHILEETEPGLYHLSITLPPGEYFYYFQIGVNRILDPRNYSKRQNERGERFSHFIIE